MNKQDKERLINLLALNVNMLRLRAGVDLSNEAAGKEIEFMNRCIDQLKALLNEFAEKTGNVVIAGDSVFAGISDDPEEDALTEFKYAMVIEFDSADAFGKALREGTAHFTVFEDRTADN